MKKSIIEIKTGDTLRLNSINEGFSNWFGHIPGDEGKVVNMNGRVPIVLVSGKVSNSRIHTPAAPWNSIYTNFEKI